MHRIFVWSLCLAGILTLSGCQESDVGLEEQEPVCVPAGHWRAVEERRGGDCAPDRIPESIVTVDMTEVDVADEGALWRFELTRGGERLESCSGMPSDDRCRVDVTCSSIDSDGNRIDYALTLDLTEAGALSGSNVLNLVPEEGDECQAQFTLEGEKVSPMEIESDNR